MVSKLHCETEKSRAEQSRIGEGMGIMELCKWVAGGKAS